MTAFLIHTKNFILGKNEKTTVDNRLFNVASFSFSLLSFIATGVKTVLDETTLFTWVSSSIVIVIYATLFYLSRFKGGNSSVLVLAFFVTTMYSLNSFYFLLGGSKGIVPISAVFCIVFLISISAKKFHGLMIGLVVLDILILHYLDYKNPTWSNEFVSEFARIFDLALFSISSILLAGFTVSYYKSSLNIEKEKLQCINEALLASEEELTQNAEELILINENLERAKSKAEESSKVKADFLSTMSHEIRNPLHAIIATSSSLMDDKHLDIQQERLDILNFSSENLLRLINDILDYNKIDAGKIEVNSVGFELKKYSNDLLKSFSIKRCNNKVKLSLDIDDEIPTFIEGDKYRIGQVLINLIDNALKFTEKGFVKLNVGIISKKENSCKVHFSVEDSGIGIQKENQGKVFGVFSQAKLSTEKNYGGTGLGLAISKEIVKLLGGNLTLESVPNEGSTFSFSLDFLIAKEYSSEREQSTGSVGLVGKKVLVVDDNEVNLQVVEMLVKKWDLQVIKCQSGREAVELANEESPDIVLMDVQMPGMNGFEATEEIKKMNPDLPIVALTACTSDEVKDKMDVCGMADVLTKPFVPEELYQVLLKYIY